MGTTVPKSGKRIRVSTREELENHGEAMLKHRYGPGIYVQDVEETSRGKLLVRLGNSVPKDLSDSLERDGVLKFISVRNIYTLTAEPTESSFIIELPDRKEIYDGFVERYNGILNSLDTSMAKTIYHDVLEFSEVDNQLTPIRQIIRWTHNRAPLEADEIDSNQRSGQTMRYLDILDQLDYINLEDGIVTEGERMDSANLQDVGNRSYVEVIMSDLVQRGYNTLRDECNLRMLSHYPQFSGAYYFDAIQRQKPGLHLDLEAIQGNIREQYGKDFGELYVEDKLNQLSQVGVIEKEGDYVTSVGEVYDTVNRDVQLA